MSILKKALPIFTLAILFVFIGCKEKATEGEQEIEYSEFPKTTGENAYPDYWKSSDGKIELSINGNWKDKTGISGSYQLWCGNGRSFAQGTCYYSKGGTDSKGKAYPECFVFEAPGEDEIDFSASEGSDVNKQAMLDYMFPEGKRCVIKYDGDYLEFRNKGAFVYKDSAFFASKFSAKLEPNSDTIIEGRPAILLGTVEYTPKDKTSVYTEPDINSTKLQYSAISWNQCSKDKKVKKLYDKDKTFTDWYHGMSFSVHGRTSTKENVNGVEDYWYYISYGRDYYWVFGGDIEVRDKSKQEEYNASIIEHGLKDGLIALSDVDYSNIPTDLTYIGIGEEGESAIYYNDKEIYFAFPWNGVFAKYDRSCMARDKDGFMKFKYGPKENDSYLFIFGSQINQFFTDFKNDGSLSYRDEEDDDLQRYHSYYFKNISASSSFSETLGGRKIEYSPENLEKCFEIGCKCHPYWWNYSHIPWVEGAEGNGIGEYITIEFTEDMAGMSVLNGYTDINKLKLFKENARLKEVEIEDLVNGDKWIVSFKDEVYFNYIAFPKKSSKIKMTIKSVYEGTKYSDTCVSAIIPSKETPFMLNETSMKEYRERIYNDFKEVVKDCDLLSPEELLDNIWEM